MKILIVDDDIKRRDIIFNWLTLKGILPDSIVCHDSSLGAREALRNSYFDILILDVVLPYRSNERSNRTNGLELLNHINQSSRIRKPEKIIGITAYSDDIASFRSEFERYCLTVIEVRGNDSSWKSPLLAAINYLSSSKISRSPTSTNACVITIHGIRTFGEWQNRLKRIVHEKSDGIEFHSYKYGYFSAVSFLIPFFRQKEVERLKAAIAAIIDKDDRKDVYIFCHSFGTYLAAYTLKSLVVEARVPRVKRLILCGSVLRSSFDWSFSKHIENIQIINECGDSDYILWLSEAFVPLTGMAGKVGFHGFNNKKIKNRFFSGGHSHYFSGDDFIRRMWLPLFYDHGEAPDWDERKPSLLRHEVFDQAVSILGKLKHPAYAIGLILMPVIIFQYL